VKIAIEAETEKAAKSKSKTAEPIKQLATVDHETSSSSLEHENAKQIKELCTLI
jgi:hypothetical protein